VAAKSFFFITFDFGRDDDEDRNDVHYVKVRAALAALTFMNSLR